ncbi:MAG: class I SAM-dependent methyltransferase, partial [Planctomycetota bacterium]
EGSFDLAFCLIDSFRHLTTEPAAERHLRAVARALRPGAVYVVGLDVTGGMGPDTSREEWKMSRDGVRVHGVVGGLGDVDPETRIETMRVRLDVRDHGRRRVIESFQPLRVWSPAELEALVGRSGFRIDACFDRRYDLDAPLPLEAVDGSAVLVLGR